MRNPDSVDLNLGDDDGGRLLLGELGFGRNFRFGFGTLGSTDAGEGKRTKSEKSASFLESSQA